MPGHADAELEGRKLRLGKFAGPLLPDSNFELAFENEFKTLMKDRVDDALDTFAVDDPLFARYAHAVTHLTVSPNMLRRASNTAWMRTAAANSK